MLIGGWLLDADLGQAVARLPWVVDGISDKSRHRAEDGVFVEEKAAIGGFFLTATADRELAASLVQQPWFSDGDLTAGEEYIVWFIEGSSTRDPELALFLIDFPTYADALVDTDSGNLVPELVQLAREDSRFLLTIADYAKGLDREIGVLLLGSFLTSGHRVSERSTVVP